MPFWSPGFSELSYRNSKSVSEFIKHIFYTIMPQIQPVFTIYTSEIVKKWIHWNFLFWDCFVSAWVLSWFISSHRAYFLLTQWVISFALFPSLVTSASERFFVTFISPVIRRFSLRIEGDPCFSMRFTQFWGFAFVLSLPRSFFSPSFRLLFTFF